MKHPSSVALVASLALTLGACAAAPTDTPASSPASLPAMTEADATATPERTPEPTGTEATSGPASASPSASEAPADPLLAVELRDVRSGDTFTLGQLAAEHGPVLLEPMAIWCSNCRAQQREVVTAHESGTFSSVSLNIELNERGEDLAAYAEREGFDWHFAMADAELYRALQERFGINVTNPPLTPLIIIGADGSVRALEFGRGVRSATELLDELGAG